MTYLYHLVPKNMQCSILYPLNLLREKYPEIYKQQIKKYEGREHIMKQKIPHLNCAWNDVLFFSAVNPNDIKTALLEADHKKYKTKRYFKISPTILKPENTLIYLYSHLDSLKKMDQNNFIKYDPNDLEKYSKLPNETKVYYKEQISLDRKPLLWHKTPHILYRGSLDIKDLEIVES